MLETEMAFRHSQEATLLRIKGLLKLQAGGATMDKGLTTSALLQGYKVDQGRLDDKAVPGQLEHMEDEA